MNKALSKKLEQVARKHSKSNNVLGAKDSFIKGGEFINKNSEKQYTEKDMFQITYDALGYFAYKNNIIISGKDITKWFKTYIKKA